MKKIEFIQRSWSGGHPVPHEANRTDQGEPTFGHGEAVYVVSKRELMGLLYRVRGAVLKEDGFGSQNLQEIDEILMEDEFVARGPDLPEESLRRRRKKG